MSSEKDVYYVDVNQQLLKVVRNIQDILSSPNATSQDMKMASLILRPLYFTDVMIDRTNSARCAFPLCPHTLTKEQIQTKMIHDPKTHSFVEAPSFEFCSDHCRNIALEYRSKLSDEPIQLRSALQPVLTNKPHPKFQSTPTAQESVHPTDDTSSNTTPVTPQSDSSSKPDSGIVTTKKNSKKKRSTPKSQQSTADQTSPNTSSNTSSTATTPPAPPPLLNSIDDDLSKRPVVTNKPNVQTSTTAKSFDLFTPKRQLPPSRFPTVTDPEAMRQILQDAQQQRQQQQQQQQTSQASTVVTTAGVAYTSTQPLSIAQMIQQNQQTDTKPSSTPQSTLPPDSSTEPPVSIDSSTTLVSLSSSTTKPPQNVSSSVEPSSNDNSEEQTEVQDSIRPPWNLDEYPNPFNIPAADLDVLEIFLQELYDADIPNAVSGPIVQRIYRLQRQGHEVDTIRNEFNSLFRASILHVPLARTAHVASLPPVQSRYSMNEHLSTSKSTIQTTDQATVEKSAPQTATVSQPVLTNPPQSTPQSNQTQSLQQPQQQQPQQQPQPQPQQQKPIRKKGKRMIVDPDANSLLVTRTPATTATTTASSSAILENFKVNDFIDVHKKSSPSKLQSNTFGPSDDFDENEHKEDPEASLESLLEQPAPAEEDPNELVFELSPEQLAAIEANDGRALPGVHFKRSTTTTTQHQRPKRIQSTQPGNKAPAWYLEHIRQRDSARQSHDQLPPLADTDNAQDVNPNVSQVQIRIVDDDTAALFDCAIPDDRPNDQDDDDIINGPFFDDESDTAISTAELLVSIDKRLGISTSNNADVTISQKIMQGGLPVDYFKQFMDGSHLPNGSLKQLRLALDSCCSDWASSETIVLVNHVLMGNPLPAQAVAQAPQRIQDDDDDDNDLEEEDPRGFVDDDIVNYGVHHGHLPPQTSDQKSQITSTSRPNTETSAQEHKIVLLEQSPFAKQLIHHLAPELDFVYTHLLQLPEHIEYSYQRVDKRRRFMKTDQKIMATTKHQIIKTCLLLVRHMSPERPTVPVVSIIFLRQFALLLLFFVAELHERSNNLPPPSIQSSSLPMNNPLIASIVNPGQQYNQWMATLSLPEQISFNQFSPSWFPQIPFNSQLFDKTPEITPPTGSTRTVQQILDMWQIDTFFLRKLGNVLFFM